MRKIHLKYRILSFTLLIYFLFTITLTYFQLRSILENDAFQDMENSIHLSENRVDHKFNDIEKSVTIMAQYISDSIDLSLIDDLDYMEQFNNTIIDRLVYSSLKSSSVAMASYFYANIELFDGINENDYNFSQWYYSLDENVISHGERTKFKEFVLSDPAYEWYFAPFQKGPHWTEPYVDSTAFDTQMISYLMPVEVSGITIGMVGMDIKYENVLTELSQNDFTANGFTSLLDSELKFIVDPHYAGQYINEIDDDSLKFASTLIQNNALGHFSYEIDNESFMSAFVRLSNGQVLIISAPKNEVLNPLVKSQYDLYLIIFLSFIIFIVVIDYFIKSLVNTSTVDFMTGLYNRRYMINTLQSEIYISERYQHPFSLIFIDIDYFKMINDSYGHATGDRVIKSVSKILKSCLRKTDTVSRWGGDEFIILCKNANLESAKKIVEKLKHEIDNQFISSKTKITCSYGVVTWKAGETFENLITRADKALYKAKQNGRDIMVSEDEVG